MRAARNSAVVGAGASVFYLAMIRPRRGCGRGKGSSPEGAGWPAVLSWLGDMPLPPHTRTPYHTHTHKLTRTRRMSFYLSSLPLPLKSLISRLSLPHYIYNLNPSTEILALSCAITLFNFFSINPISESTLSFTLLQFYFYFFFLRNPRDYAAGFRIHVAVHTDHHFSIAFVGSMCSLCS